MKNYFTDIFNEAASNDDVVIYDANKIAH